MTESALITGGAGFVGMHLSRMILEQTDWNIFIVDNFDRGLDDAELQALKRDTRITLIHGDLSDATSLAEIPKVEWIFHLAAVVGVKNVENRPAGVLEINALSSINVSKFASECSNLKRLVFASTSEVYAGTLEHFGMAIPTPEDTPLALADISKGRTTYALSKLFGEALFQMNAVGGIMKSVIVRYHNIYGPRMGYMHVIPELAYRMSKESEVEVFSPGHTRAFCFVEDAARITLDLARKGGRFGVYNVGNPEEEIHMMDLASKIKTIGNFSCQLIGGENNPGSPHRRCPDIQRVIEDLGPQSFHSLDSGLRKTIDWYGAVESARHE